MTKVLASLDAIDVMLNLYRHDLDFVERLEIVRDRINTRGELSPHNFEEDFMACTKKGKEGKGSKPMKGGKK